MLHQRELAWINDSPTGEWISPRSLNGFALPFADWTDMPNTAIALIYTPEGFVIAADGRMRLRGKTVSETRQKVFPIDEETRKLAYALSGNVVLPEGESVVFDFAATGKEAVEALSKRNPPGLVRYADRVAEKIYRALLAKRLPRYPDEDGKGTVAYLVIAGYYDGVPSFVRVRFYHRNQKLAYPLVDDSEMFRATGRRFQGSPIVDELLFNDVPSPLARYRSVGFEKLKRRESLTLDEALEVARGFIAACSSDEARRLDKDCETVGGHMHVVTITEAEGFRWVIAPRESP